MTLLSVIYMQSIVHFPSQIMVLFDEYFTIDKKRFRYRKQSDIIIHYNMLYHFSY